MLLRKDKECSPFAHAIDRSHDTDEIALSGEHDISGSSFDSAAVVADKEISVASGKIEKTAVFQINDITLAVTVFEGWDNRGTLTFSKQALLEGISELDETPSGVYLIVQDVEGHFLYVDLSYVLGLKTAA